MSFLRVSHSLLLDYWLKPVPVGSASWPHTPKPRCVLSTRSIYERISASSRGGKDIARDLMRHLQGNQAESKSLRSEECPLQHVLVMFPPWSKAIHFQ